MYVCMHVRRGRACPATPCRASGGAARPYHVVPAAVWLAHRKTKHVLIHLQTVNWRGMLVLLCSAARSVRTPLRTVWLVLSPDHFGAYDAFMPPPPRPSQWRNVAVRE